jgi:DNA-binding NarL/FixJ family response regulator
VAGDGDLLTAADEARLRADWERARELYAQALAEDPDDPEALDGLGMTSFWVTGEWKEALELRGRAYAAFRRRGDRCRAAGIAVALAEESRIEGNEAAANGWLARAERLLEGVGECVERGWLAIERAKRSAAAAERQALAKEALGIARRLDDSDLEVAALAHFGLARTMAGNVEAGMAILDEAMAAATGGEASDPLAIGETCCMTLVACDEWSDFKRAAEWCRVVVEFTRRRNYTPLAAWCRTIYAGVLTTLGDWTRAEEQLVASLQIYERLGSASRIYALSRLADLRIRQGRLEEAERLLEGHTEHPLALGPMVALHVERGELELAAARLQERLDQLPPDSPALAPLLPMVVDVRILQGNLGGAGEALERLRELGRSLRREHLIACAELAAAKVSAARRDGAAGAHLQAALELFARLEMPLDEAHARLELARHNAALGSELAVPEAQAALSVFERLGAARDADAAAKLLRSLGVAGRTIDRGVGELTKREREVLDLLAAGLSNAEIGERLFITPKTVEHHVGRVLSKLGLRNRTEAAAYLLREHAGPPGA